MADIPENKQKRLMSLNQDVLAVSPGQAPAREREAPRANRRGVHHHARGNGAAAGWWRRKH